MERLLKPDRLNTDPNASPASKKWLHWLWTFENFLTVLPQKGLDKLSVLTNYVSPKIFVYIEECTEYDRAIVVLKELFVKPKNEIFARNVLATRSQQIAESLDEYLQVLKTLSKDCNYQVVTAVQNRDNAIRDAFITGLQSSHIRQHLLENKTLDLATIFDQARALESTQKSSESYGFTAHPVGAAMTSSTPLDSDYSPDRGSSGATGQSYSQGSKCYFCGSLKYPRSKYPAREATCHKCQRREHFAKVCRANPTTNPTRSRTSSAMSFPTTGCSSVSTSAASVLATAAPSLDRSTYRVNINGVTYRALMDSGSSESFINPHLAELHGLQVYSSSGTVSLASVSHSYQIHGYCETDLALMGHQYKNVRLHELPDLCADLILGLDFQTQHQSITLNYGEKKDPLDLVCGLSSLNVKPPDLFANLTDDCHPVASKSCRYSFADKQFIEKETKRLLEERIIEKSNSPWRAQIVVVKDPYVQIKRRLAVDYS